ncbi:MAG: N-acetyltransferase [Alphaproteobacteria bacterium]|nr:N-acetyltransferase [Alphaproteobacteria bacterium]
MPSDIIYQELQNNGGFCAKCDGRQIGEIDIITVGADRLIIESTQIDDKYRDTDLCYNLVKCVVEFARKARRKILCLCPRAQSVFNKYPEFDDVRMIHIVK